MLASLHQNRADVRAAAIAVAVGLLLALAPHLTMLACHGTVEFLADGDDELYLAVAKPAYYGENGLRDPYALPSERVPCLYAWMQFVPTAKLTVWLGLPLVANSILWRVLGGSLLGLALYVVFRQLFRDTSRPVTYALACGLICLADAGFVEGRSLVASAWLLQGYWTPVAQSQLLPQYRVVTPLTNLPFLLLLFAVFLGPRPRSGISLAVAVGCL